MRPCVIALVMAKGGKRGKGREGGGGEEGGKGGGRGKEGLCVIFVRSAFALLRLGKGKRGVAYVVLLSCVSVYSLRVFCVCALAFVIAQQTTTR